MTKETSLTNLVCIEPSSDKVSFHLKRLIDLKNCADQPSTSFFFSTQLYILTSCFFKARKSLDMFLKSTCLSCLAAQSLGIWRSLTDCQLARLITSLIFSFQPLFPPSRNSVIDSVHKLDFPGSVNHQVAPRGSK